MSINVNTLLFPVGGAILGYLIGDKDTAVRNSVVGALIGFGANWFMKPNGSNSEIPASDALEDLPPPVDPVTGDIVPSDTVPEAPESPAPNGDVDYIPDDGSSSSWVGKDPFPVGAVARFAVPLQTSANVLAAFAVKMGNGNWVTQPGQEVFWTSVGKLGRDPRVRVIDIIDQGEQMSYWTQGDPQPLSTYP